jgi:hypothetical protein
VLDVPLGLQADDSFSSWFSPLDRLSAELIARNSATLTRVSGRLEPHCLAAIARCPRIQHIGKRLVFAEGLFQAVKACEQLTSLDLGMHDSADAIRLAAGELSCHTVAVVVYAHLEPLSSVRPLLSLSVGRQGVVPRLVGLSTLSSLTELGLSAELLDTMARIVEHCGRTLRTLTLQVLPGDQGGHLSYEQLVTHVTWELPELVRLTADSLVLPPLSAPKLTALDATPDALLCVFPPAAEFAAEVRLANFGGGPLMRSDIASTSTLPPLTELNLRPKYPQMELSEAWLREWLPQFRSSLRRLDAAVSVQGSVESANLLLQLTLRSLPLLEELSWNVSHVSFGSASAFWSVSLARTKQRLAELPSSAGDSKTPSLPLRR